MSKFWEAMVDKYGSEEKARAEMARRGGNSKGKKKSYNKLRDEEGYAKELRSRGTSNGKKT